MSHIVESCPQTRLHGGLSKLHSADDNNNCISTIDSVIRYWTTLYISLHQVNIVLYCTVSKQVSLLGILAAVQVNRSPVYDTIRLLTYGSRKSWIITTHIHTHIKYIYDTHVVITNMSYNYYYDL